MKKLKIGDVIQLTMINDDLSSIRLKNGKLISIDNINYFNRQVQTEIFDEAIEDLKKTSTILYYFHLFDRDIINVIYQNK